MPTLYIEAFKFKDEYEDRLQVPEEPVGNQKVTVSTVAQSAAAFPASTTHVMLLTDTACQYELADPVPTASATSRFLPANVPLFIRRAGAKSLSVITQV